MLSFLLCLNDEPMVQFYTDGIAPAETHEKRTVRLRHPSHFAQHLCPLGYLCQHARGNYNVETFRRKSKRLAAPMQQLNHEIMVCGLRCGPAKHLRGGVDSYHDEAVLRKRQCNLARSDADLQGAHPGRDIAGQAIKESLTLLAGEGLQSVEVVQGRPGLLCRLSKRIHLRILTKIGAEPYGLLPAGLMQHFATVGSEAESCVERDRGFVVGEDPQDDLFLAAQTELRERIP